MNLRHKSAAIAKREGWIAHGEKWLRTHHGNTWNMKRRKFSIERNIAKWTAEIEKLKEQEEA